MLTKNFTQRLAKDALNLKRELDFERARLEAERFNDRKTMRLRNVYFMGPNLLQRKSLRKSVSVGPYLGAGRMAFKVETSRLARRASLISDTILCFSNIASGLLPLA